MPDVDLAFLYAEVTNEPVAVDLVLAYAEYTGNPMATPLATLVETWDELAAPAITGWSTAQLVNTGTAGAWATSTTQKNSGVNSASYNSNVATAGNSTRLWMTASFDMTQQPDQALLTFWLRHDSGNSAKNDTIQACVSTDAGSTWTLLGSPIARYLAGTAGWTRYTVDLTSYAAQTALLIGFVAISQVGGAMYLDDIWLLQQPTTEAQVDMVFAYAEVLNEPVGVDMVFAYAEVAWGSSSAPLFGGRWQ